MLSMLHTVETNAALFEGLLNESASDVPFRHQVNEELLRNAMRDGSSDPDVVEAVTAAVRAAGEGAKVLLCTCSTIGGIAESVALSNGAPVLRVDRAMAREAVATGTRIVIAAAVESTLEPTRRLVEDEARRQGRSVELTEQVIGGAWDRLQSDGTEAYHAAVAEGLRQIAASAPDVIVLAQATMAGAVDRCADLPVPILASPRLGLADAVAHWRAGA